MLGQQITNSMLLMNEGVQKELKLTEDQVAKIKEIPIKARVRLEWVFEERPRVEKIEVLKDPANTAMYGSRGANGVIIIKTKKP